MKFISRGNNGKGIIGDVNVSEFDRFEPCPRCHVSGCKPVLGRYDDGHAFCFYCGYSEKAGVIRRVVDHFSRRTSHKDLIGPTRNDHPSGGGDGTPPKADLVRQLPYDIVNWTSLEMSQWLANYGITREETISNNVMYSPAANWLIFPYRSQYGMLLAWQARVFPKNRPEDERDVKSKWLSFGPVHDIIHIRTPQPGHQYKEVPLTEDGNNLFPDTVVLVEDIVSAIKVGRQASCVPVFGVGLTSKIATRLSKRFKRAVVWFDRDAARKGTQVAAMASQFFESTNTVVSEKDPKSYGNNEIRGYLTEIK